MARTCVCTYRDTAFDFDTRFDICDSMRFTIRWRIVTALVSTYGYYDIRLIGIAQPLPTNKTTLQSRYLSRAQSHTFKAAVFGMWPSEVNTEPVCVYPCFHHCTGSCCWRGPRRSLYWWRSVTPTRRSFPCRPSTGSAKAYWQMVRQPLKCHFIFTICVQENAVHLD